MAAPAPTPADFAPLAAAIHTYAQDLFHAPEGCLHHPYVDPGGPYAKNLWDWDSFWVITGLFTLARREHGAVPERLRTAAAGVLDNFLLHQGADGSLPILLMPDNPDVFGGVTDPKLNMAKPVFGQYLALLAQAGEPAERLRPRLTAIHRFHASYRQRYRHPKTGLYLWAEDVAIGVDDDPASWGRPPFSSANLLLNGLLLADLNAVAQTARELGETDIAATAATEAAELTAALRTYCWDERDGFFYSVDVQCEQRRHPHRLFGELNINLTPFWNCLPMKVMSWCGFLPLWLGIADATQARRLVREHLLNDRQFWSPWGVRSLAADERMYRPADCRGNPSNWLGPVWIIPQYLVWSGLRRYGFNDEAAEVALRTRRVLAEEFQRSGVMYENYDPETGRGVACPGFWSWNILAAVME
jgi:putative isomerase